MVKKDSIIVNKKEIKFIVTDFKNEIIVSYKGAVPNLFAERKGVVVEGILQDKKFFVAEKILAKHDENYMPPKEENNVKWNRHIICFDIDFIKFFFNFFFYKGN